MNNNPYAINLVHKQHEQDIIRFIEKGRSGASDNNTNNTNIVRRIVSQLKKRA